MHAEEYFTGLEVMFLASLSLSKNGSETLKCRRLSFLGSNLEFLLEKVGEACEFAFLTHSKVMPLMLIQGPHLEDHCSILAWMWQ